MTQEQKEYGKKLKQLREGSKMTQAEVCKKLGYQTGQFISNWERGLAFPPMKVLPKLSKFYRVPLESLFEEQVAITMKQTERTMRREFERVSRKWN